MSITEFPALRTGPRRGFNLVEAAIVLGVVGIVIGGIWVTASTVMENIKVNQALNGMQTIVENFRRNWKGFSLDAMEASPNAPYMGQDPTGFQNIEGFTYQNLHYIYDPWGRLMAATFDNHGTLGEVFSLSLYDVPRSVCMKMLFAWGGSGKWRGIKYIHTPVSDIYETDFPWQPTVADCPTNANTVGAAFAK